MDPVATLRRIRELCERIPRYESLTLAFEQDVEDLVELFAALDAWRGKGGFDPWERERFERERSQPPARR